jgi:hypothetical protein
VPVLYRLPITITINNERKKIHDTPTIITLTKGNNWSPKSCFCSCNGFPSKEEIKDSILMPFETDNMDEGVGGVGGGGNMIFDSLYNMYT